MATSTAKNMKSKEIMMKTSVIVVMLLLMVSIIVPANAQEFYTIQEIAQQAEEGWHQTYTAHGREISVNVDIDVPNVDALPIQKLELACVELTSENTKQEAWAITVKPEVSYISIENKQYSEEYLLTRNNVDMRATGSYFAPLDLNKVYTATSDVTLAEAVQAVRQTLEDVGLDKELFVLEMPWKVSITDFFEKGADISAQAGLYNFDFYQQISGIPILRHVGTTFKKQTLHWYWPHLYTYVFSDVARVHTLKAKLLESNKIIAENIPLCSFQTITDSIKKEIDDGCIRKVFDLDLGYVLYDDPTHIETSSGFYQFFIAIPAWRLNCIYIDDANKEATDYTGGEEFERDSLEYVTLIINAQTGEIEDHRSTQKNRADYKGFISWEDVNGN